MAKQLPDSSDLAVCAATSQSLSTSAIIRNITKPAIGVDRGQARVPVTPGGIGRFSSPAIERRHRVARGFAHRSDAIQLGVFLREGRDERSMVGLRAGDMFDQFRGPVALAFAMNLGAQPGEQAAIVALREGLIEPAQVGLGPSEELGRVEIAQRVGWKVADEPGTPVNVLKAAFGVVARLDAQGLLVLLVPGRRQLANGQVAG